MRLMLHEQPYEGTECQYIYFCFVIFQNLSGL